VSTEIEDRLRAHLQVMAESTDVPPIPDCPATSRRPARRRRRRIVLAAAAAAVLMPVGGIGFAAATGHLTAGQSLFFTGQTDDGLTPDLNTVQQILTSPGPDGKEFVLYATGTTHGGGRCVAFGFVGRNAVIEKSGDACASGHPWWWPTRDDSWAFGGSGGSSGGGDLIMTFGYTAGTTTRAVIRYPDGHTMPVPVAHRWVGGWLSAGTRGPLELIGYDAAGHVVGQRPLYLGTND
jgi:hypothetical protein